MNKIQGNVNTPKVHSMHLDFKIFGIESAPCRHGGIDIT